jgi:hypothetical protein
MKLFSTHKKSFAPVWRYKTDGLLWRFLISPRGQILGETRDVAEKKASFFCLDEQSGTPLWEHLCFDEPWWIGIEEIAGTTAFFHRYRKPEQPQHRGIIAVDLLTGKKKWESPDCQYLFSFENSVYGWREMFEGQRYYALDASTGDNVQDFGHDDSTIKRLKNLVNAEDAFADYKYPEPADRTLNEHDPFHRLAIRHSTARRPASMADALIHESYALLSWHEQAAGFTDDDPLYDQMFAILGRAQGAPVFTDIIHHNSRHISQDSFFMKGRLVFYVKDAHILCAHLLD